MDYRKALSIIALGFAGWIGLATVGLTGDVASLETTYAFIQDDLIEIKTDVKEIKEILVRLR